VSENENWGIVFVNSIKRVSILTDVLILTLSLRQLAEREDRQMYRCKLVKLRIKNLYICIKSVNP